MTVQASNSATTAIDEIDLDAPIFDPGAFRLNDEQAAIIATARGLGQTVFAGRAAAYDREAKFPTRELPGPASRRPARHRDSESGRRSWRRLPDLCAGRRRDRPLLRRDRADLEHARLLDAVVRSAGRRSRHGRGHPRRTRKRRRAVHYRRIVEDGAIYSQPFSEGGAAAAGGVAFGTEAKPVEGGWIVNGKKIFASLSGHADYYGVLCTEIARRRGGLAAATRSISRCRPRPTASPWSATGIRWACAARYRARCCSRTCSWPKTRR